MRRLALLTFVVVSIGCFEPDETAISGTDNGTTGAPIASTGPQDDVSTGGPIDPPSDGSSSSGGADETGGCSPGVFGRAQFGNACFQ